MILSAASRPTALKKRTARNYYTRRRFAVYRGGGVDPCSRAAVDYITGDGDDELAYRNPPLGFHNVHL